MSPRILERVKPFFGGTPHFLRGVLYQEKAYGDDFALPGCHFFWMFFIDGEITLAALGALSLV